MKDILPQILRFNIPFIFVLIIIAVAAALAYMIYKQTNPQHSTFLRTFLATLRSIILVIIMILFFKPQILLQFTEEKPKNIALIIDHSASMGWIDENENRADSTRAAVSEIENELSGYDINLKKIYFNQDVLDSTDSPGKPFGTTNFNSVLDFLKKSKFNQAILVSDGIRTEGIIPQIEHIPVFTVGVGKKSIAPDLFISNVEYTPVVYQDKDQKITVKIANNNLPESSARIVMHEGKKIIDSKKIITTASGTEQEIIFNYKARRSGIQRYRVEIIPAAKDSNIKNNTFTFTQEVLKSKIRIGIFSSIPNNEHKFLKFLLSASHDFEIHSFIKIKNRFYDQYPMDSLDVVILQGYPTTNTDQSEFNMLTNSIRKNRPGTIFMLDNLTDISRMSVFEINHFANKIERRRTPLSVTVSPGDISNILLRVYNDNDQINLFFNAIPPLTSFFSIDGIKKGTQVLLSGNYRGVRANTLLIREEKNSKMVLFNGAGFWRWYFSLQRDNKTRDGYKNLLTNIIHWVANKNKFKPVVLNINKTTVNPGQEIIFDGRLFNAQNSPVKNGQMVINARQNKEKFTIAMQADSNGGYRASYTPVSEGSYVFEAQGFDEGKQIGSDSKEAVVIPYNREFIKTNQDTSFLHLLAENSGGKYFSLNKLDSLTNYLDVNKTETLVKDELELRFKSWLLYFVIAVAALEWAMRKKNSLP